MKLKGDETLGRTLVYLKSMIKTSRVEKQRILIELGHIEAKADTHHKYSTTFEEVSKEFNDVFRDPDGLPPVRGHEHKIELPHAFELINVRQYKYPQKKEIEKLVKDMLQGRNYKTQS